MPKVPDSVRNFFVPGLKLTLQEVWDVIYNKLKERETHKKAVLVIVSISLFLNNMLYMVIVPIIPDYLRKIGSWDTTHLEGGNKIKYSDTDVLRNYTNTSGIFITKSVLKTKLINQVVVYEGKNTAIGLLFASKALIQLMVNPISGTIIDRVGYNIPFTFGLIVMFVSTVIFAYGTSYSVLFSARSLQGVGSAFADTAGLAMIADTYTEKSERTKALGIALAFISFGCLVAPPFAETLYEFGGKQVPFIILAFVSLFVALFLRMVMCPIKDERNYTGFEHPKGTPIYRLFMDPYILTCSGALMLSNVSLAFLEPTISVWIMDNMHIKEWQLGTIWLPAFFPHVAGVILTVKLSGKYPQYQWILAVVGLAFEGIACFFLPFATNYWVIMLPICLICFGIALIDTALLPLLGHLVDTRYVSVYGSIYAIADISYSFAYAFGPMIAGGVVESIGFVALNIIIALSNLLYCPLIYSLRHVYDIKTFEDGTTANLGVGASKGYMDGNAVENNDPNLEYSKLSEAHQGNYGTYESMEMQNQTTDYNNHENQEVRQNVGTNNPFQQQSRVNY